MSGETQRWVVVARVLRPRGNKGEVAAEILTDYPERLTNIREVFVGDASASGAPHPMSVRSCWLDRNHRGQIAFHFESCASIDDAEKLRGLNVLLPIEQRVNLPPGHYFVSDLMGCSVFELPRQDASGVASSPCTMVTAPIFLGKVRDVQFTGYDTAGTPVLVVDTDTGELLIPLAEDICRRVDVAARRIEVILPEGLRDLNRE